MEKSLSFAEERQRVVHSSSLISGVCCCLYVVLCTCQLCCAMFILWRHADRGTCCWRCHRLGYSPRFGDKWNQWTSTAHWHFGEVLCFDFGDFKCRLRVCISHHFVAISWLTIWLIATAPTCLLSLSRICLLMFFSAFCQAHCFYTLH